MNVDQNSIGARRLTTIMSIVMDEINFLAHRHANTTKKITGEFVKSRLQGKGISEEESLHKYIL